LGQSVELGLWLVVHLNAEDHSVSDRLFTLEGKRLAVIGGASGIGFAVAELALELGAQVIIGSPRAESVDAALSKLVSATGDVVDLTEEESVSSFFANLSPLDHLAITAGDWDSMGPNPTNEIDLSAARAALNVRFWGSFAAAKHGSRYISPGGSITLTSGMLTRRPQKGLPLVTAMGGAMEGLVAALAVDLAPVRVNAVSPGLTLTNVVRKMPSEYVDLAVSRLPIPRAAEPTETASAYIYAMLNTYITGQVLPVDGGGSVV
jgi:NAD(P)-dependent dehydrogenase (short-subunit alcohol dehydrogenase family)